MIKSFSKYVGCGNDFILFDNRDATFPIHSIASLCHRQNGIGADGVILLENSDRAHFKMRIFNADGSEAEMCGNGIRCFMKYLAELGNNDPSYQIETMHRVHRVDHVGDQIRVEMGLPADCRWNMDLSYQGKDFRAHYLNTGVPHLVLFVEDVFSIPLQEWGPYFRYHSVFGPRGTNVNIAQRVGSKKMKIRTYERGVEGETLACGTGATAAALAAGMCYEWQGPVEVETRLGEILTIGFRNDSGILTNVTMQGPASCTFRGQI